MMGGGMGGGGDSDYGEEDDDIAPPGKFAITVKLQPSGQKHRVHVASSDDVKYVKQKI